MVKLSIKNDVDRSVGNFQNIFKIDLVNSVNRLLVKVGKRGSGWSLLVGIDANYNVVDFKVDVIEGCI